MKLQYIKCKSIRIWAKEHDCQVSKEALTAIDKAVCDLMETVILRHGNRTRISATEIELAKLRG